MRRPELFAGLLLIGLGVLLFVAMQSGVGPEAIPAVIGAVFLVAYAVTRSYGFLIPGGILTGLGTGVVLQARGADDAVVVLGLGTGFLLVAVVDQIVEGVHPARLWPLIPGGILALVGVSEFEGTAEVLRWWPLLLVAAGVWLIVTRGRPPRSRRQSEPRPPAAPS